MGFFSNKTVQQAVQQLTHTMPLPLTKPEDAPLPGATASQALGRAISKTFQFSGRASRSEFWWYAGSFTAVTATAGALELRAHLKKVKEFRYEYPAAFQKMTEELEALEAPSQGLSTREKSEFHRQQARQRKAIYQRFGYPSYTPGPLFWGTILAGGAPLSSLGIRRLHDSNLSGWWYLPAEASGLSPFLYLRASRPEGKRFDRPLP